MCQLSEGRHGCQTDGQRIDIAGVLVVLPVRGIVLTMACIVIVFTPPHG